MMLALTHVPAEVDSPFGRLWAGPLLATVPLGELPQRCGVSAPEHRPFADKGARPDLGDRSAVDQHVQHTVEQQEQLASGVALASKLLPPPACVP